MDSATWAAAGATSETPAPAPVTPPPAPTPEAAPVAAPATPSPVASNRDDKGKFTATAPPPATGAPTPEGAAQVAADAKAAGATPAQQAAAVQDYLEAQVEGGEPIRIPLTAKIPWKQRGQDGFASIKEIQQAHLFHRDYTRNMQQLAGERERFAEERQHAERERVANEARWSAQERERKLFLEAQRDPAKQAQLEQHLEQMATNPEYARRWEKAMEADVYEAVAEHEQAVDMQHVASSIAADARAYITEQSAKYPGVDAQRVLGAYQQAWFELDNMEPAARDRQERALRSSKYVDAIFAKEAEQVAKVTGPLRGELDELKRQLAALQAEREADKTNGRRTAHRERTTSAVAGAPLGGGSPPAMPGKQPTTVYPAGQREERTRAWVNAG